MVVGAQDRLTVALCDVDSGSGFPRPLPVLGAQDRLRVALCYLCDILTCFLQIYIRLIDSVGSRSVFLRDSFDWFL